MGLRAERGDAYHAPGALIGVAYLNSEWIGGMGIFNLKILTVIGILPSLVLSFWISHLKSNYYIIAIATVVLISLILSSILSYYFGIAMIGI